MPIYLQKWWWKRNEELDQLNNSAEKWVYKAFIEFAFRDLPLPHGAAQK